MFLNYVIKSFRFISVMEKNPPYIRKLEILLTMGPIVQLTGMAMAVFETSEIRYLSLVLGFVLCVSYAYSQILMSIYDKKIVHQIMNRILGIHSNYPNFIDEQLTRKIETRTEQKSTAEIIFFIFSSSLCVFCPLMCFVTKPGIRYDHPDVQVIPFYYPFWRTNSVFNYICKKGFEYMVTSTCLCPYYIFTTFLTYTMTSLETHIEEMNRQVNRMMDEHVAKYMSFHKFHSSINRVDDCFILGDANDAKREEYEKNFEKDFGKMIEYHNFIHGFLADVTRFLHKPMTSLFAWYISSTVLFTFAFLTVTDDVIYIMKMFSLVIHGNVALRLLCSMAELINHMNEKLGDSFYNTSWYYLQPKSRKNLLIIFTLCQRKYEVKCFGMYVVNLNLFIFAVRIVYSVMNIVIVRYK